MIAPRRTRLVRVRDLHAFRDAILALTPSEESSFPLVVVPTAGAARQLRRLMENRQRERRSSDVPDLVTRDGLYDALHVRMADPPRRLSPYEREVMAQASVREASALADQAHGFQFRAGLVAELLRFYDQLKRQTKRIVRFEELAGELLERDAEFDRGARRMLQQTRLLAASFRAYERRVDASGACDEHTLRERLLAGPSPSPVRAILVTVADWIADPGGLYVADFDLLARLPGAETIDLVATEAVLASGFHERLHDWLPGLEEIDFAAAIPAGPALAVPAGTLDRSWFMSRDREEELIAIVRRVRADQREREVVGTRPRALGRVAVVYGRPLPYLYLAREVFGGANVPYQTADALPLASEPFAAALDLVFEFVASSFSRDALVALLRSPHFVFEDGTEPIARKAVSALDRGLSEGRYLGSLDQLSRLAELWAIEHLHDDALPALRAGLRAAVQLSDLGGPAPASVQIERLLSFLNAHARPWDDADRLTSRHRRAQDAIFETLRQLATASRAHDDAPVDANGLASTVRRWIEERTFAPDSDAREIGVQLLDEPAARYGDFDEVAIVGVIEGEWPERPQRNIFYPPNLLRGLGWPSEKDWRGAAEARFIDLLKSPVERVYVSAITLDDEALVEPSSLLDECPRARLSTVGCEPSPPGRIFVEEALSLDPVGLDSLTKGTREWAEMRLARSPASGAMFHGQAEGAPARPWSVSAIETYITCPFKFFARYVLQLEEEPDDEEVMDPRAQGLFVHEVFEAFFERWQESGHHAVTAETLDEARAMFEVVVEQSLESLSETERALERTRLLGSPVAAGLGEAVLRMEAERPVDVTGRLLEYRLKGPFRFETEAGPRALALSGKVDRVDLLADGTFRVIDYKLGSAPNKARALQLPVYSLCAQQSLAGYLNRNWTVSEAAYVVFKGPRRVVPLFTPGDRDRILRESQERLVQAVDAISRGEFPPRPEDVHWCETCTYAAVCRKDYVGDI